MQSLSVMLTQKKREYIRSELIRRLCNRYLEIGVTKT